MSKVRVHNFSISLDGFGTGEPQSFEAPFGHAGERLHEWMFVTNTWLKDGGGLGMDNAFAQRTDHGIGAEIMGRRKFGPQTGPWTDVGTEDEWKGWWGPNPPFHSPVFVMTHHERPPIQMEGGTTFYFTNASPAEILAAAKEAAGGLDIRLGGGARSIRAFLEADLVDHMHLVQAPIVLGRGERIWDGQEGLEDRFDIEAVSSPFGVTHLTFARKA